LKQQWLSKRKRKLWKCKPDDGKLPTGENMSKLQSDVQKAKEHERNLTSSADALKEGSGVGYDGQTTCSPNCQMQQVYDKQEGQSQNFRNDLTRDAAAISCIAESLDRLDRVLAK